MALLNPGDQVLIEELGGAVEAPTTAIRFRCAASRRRRRLGAGSHFSPPGHAPLASVNSSFTWSHFSGIFLAASVQFTRKPCLGHVPVAFHRGGGNSQHSGSFLNA
jgi:hypothetical protein